jgi:hypothetical protein
MPLIFKKFKCRLEQRVQDGAWETENTPATTGLKPAGPLDVFRAAWVSYSENVFTKSGRILLFIFLFISRLMTLTFDSCVARLLPLATEVTVTNLR